MRPAQRQGGTACSVATERMMVESWRGEKAPLEARPEDAA
eukprot:CAMPEP_0202901980 /NCGR_PEP_ID=MMETSP1392-20130828/15667_1 /ASSEMBLY_ACC=CAM_ASM_000868 /TAXON_ID=225041 /ORGANISM="Chlamydomonas chlamydogama, Strain SAG 11-48b" /LENGTH=39 /DNA_ID= /DNA_START= /DNA_END= /DNA_ORIENTATION=